MACQEGLCCMDLPQGHISMQHYREHILKLTPQADIMSFFFSSYIVSYVPAPGCMIVFIEKDNFLTSNIIYFVCL
jgi:hypothetical protein